MSAHASISMLILIADRARKIQKDSKIRKARDRMGLSKKDIARRRANLKRRLEELEKKAKYDVLNKELQAEVAALRKQVEEL